jgi:hypothetical protein
VQDIVDTGMRSYEYLEQRRVRVCDLQAIRWQQQEELVYEPAHIHGERGVVHAEPDGDELGTKLNIWCTIEMGKERNGTRNSPRRQRNAREAGGSTETK